MSERADKIHESFEKVADLAFKNIPKDISVCMIIYVRDRSTGENGGDGTIDIRKIITNCTYYDGMSIREYVNHNLLVI